MNKNIIKYEEKDQYFAHKDMVNECLNLLQEKLNELEINSDEYTYIEPSAGDGAFLTKLPKDRRFGIDIEPRHEEIVEGNFLEWNPKDEGKYITIGGPPFGNRGKLAVKFINHASQFSDVVAFILPDYFEYKTKYNCVDKIQKLTLIKSKKLSSEFYFPNGDEVTVPVDIFFQIYVKDFVL